MAVQTLLEIINQSPLSPEDKAHWKELLPKMTEEQRQHLGKTLTRKTEIVKSIKSIETALGVIDEAEQEVDEDIALESAEGERDELLDDIKALEQTHPDLKSQAPGKPPAPSPTPQTPSMPPAPAPGPLSEPQPPQPLQSPTSDSNSDALVTEKKQTEERLKQLRGELEQLSKDVGGGTPPSYKDS